MLEYSYMYNKISNEWVIFGAMSIHTFRRPGLKIRNDIVIRHYLVTLHSSTNMNKIGAPSRDDLSSGSPTTVCLPTGPRITMLP